MITLGLRIKLRETQQKMSRAADNAALVPFYDD
jgi:hypothetical protein